jgi:hypothetical protein
MLVTVDAALAELEQEPNVHDGKLQEAKPEIEEGPEGETSLQLLQNVYRDRKQPLNVRVRCAVEALVHEYKKKGTDKGTMIDGTFAEQLERELRAIERSKQLVPLLNGPVEPLPASELKGPMARLRRF